MRTALLFTFFIGLTLPTIAQLGGNYAFPFIDLSYSARSTALTGDYISIKDGDINIGVNNPSLLNSDMTGKISLSQSLMTGGVNIGMTSYGFDVKKLGTISTYIKYVNYGKFERTSINGINEGTFRPFEMVAGAGVGRQLNERLSVGGNLNMIFSQLEAYTSVGASVDFAGTYYDADKQFLVTAMAKHVGAQFKSFANNGNRGTLPTEIQAAVSYKLAHAPFRLSLLAHHLNKWDLTYNDPTLIPTIDALTGDTIPVPRAGFGEKLARHFSYQIEAPISEKFHLRIGFDYHRRRTLALEQRPGAAGFSFGTGLYFRRFILDYAFLVYSAAGFNHQLTLSINTREWRK